MILISQPRGDSDMTGYLWSVWTMMISVFAFLWHSGTAAGFTFEVEFKKKKKKKKHCQQQTKGTFNPATDMQSSGAFTECKTCAYEQWEHWSVRVNCA